MNNKNLIAALSLENSIVYIFESRNTNVSLVELKFHKDSVTGMVWTPNNHMQICSVSEDKMLLLVMFKVILLIKIIMYVMLHLVK